MYIYDGYWINPRLRLICDARPETANSIFASFFVFFYVSCILVHLKSSGEKFCSVPIFSFLVMYFCTLIDTLAL